MLLFCPRLSPPTHTEESKIPAWKSVVSIYRIMYFLASGLRTNTSSAMATNLPKLRSDEELKSAGAKVDLSFDPKYATIAVIPHPGEASDANFPRNLHNAAELFLRMGHLDSARSLSAACTRLFACYAAGPNGLNVKMGRGCVCWACGYAGIPLNADECASEVSTVKGVCAKCKSDAQTNFVRVSNPNQGESKTLPWVEVQPKDKAATDVAAEVEGSSHDAKLCAVCNKLGQRQCSRCKAAFYCSSECQVIHWKQGGHKKVCKA